MDRTFLDAHTQRHFVKHALAVLGLEVVCMIVLARSLVPAFTELVEAGARAWNI
jgi:hypothetical protein